MSLRRGVTAAEEAKMRQLIAEGATWPQVMAELEDVEADYVKEHLYEPLLAAHEAGENITKVPTPSETPAEDSTPAGTKKL